MIAYRLRIVSGDVKIAYRRFGRPGRTPLLIVHGLSFFSYDSIGPASGSPSTAKSSPSTCVALASRIGAGAQLQTRDAGCGLIVARLLGWGRAALMGHSFGGGGIRDVRLAQGSRGGSRLRRLRAGHPPRAAIPQSDRFAARCVRLVDAAMAYHGPGCAAGSPCGALRGLSQTDDALCAAPRPVVPRQLQARVGSGQSAPVPAFFWPMLAELEIPILVIRASQSDMFAPETLDKVARHQSEGDGHRGPAGTHDLAGDNPEGLVTAVHDFLSRTETVMTGVQPD